MGRPPRKPASVIVGGIAFAASYLFVFPSGCNAEGGVSSWERCTTVMGNPAFSLTDWGLDNTFDILIPLAMGVLAGVVTWWLLGSKSTHNE